MSHKKKGEKLGFSKIESFIPKPTIMQLVQGLSKNRICIFTIKFLKLIKFDKFIL